jgi:hypothetical protein
MHNVSNMNVEGDNTPIMTLTVGQQRIAVLPKPGLEIRTPIECLPEWRNSILWDNVSQSRVLVAHARPS